MLRLNRPAAKRVGKREPSMTTNYFRRLALPVLAAVSIAIGALSVSISAATFSPAQAQVSAEFQAALEAYGEWQPHPRFGEVWVPYDLPPDWRPYTYGRWVYTDDWGWYWVSDDEEADWGWVTFHYGRWAHDQRLGWFWVPGDEWGPAWVDWRRGDDFVGWAPLPPDDVIAEYDSEPAYWIFVQPRYLIAPRVRTYFLPPQRSFAVFRRTVIVNRTVRIEHRDRRGRIAVNPGIAPGIIAAATHQPVHTFRVQPRVVAGTQGRRGRRTGAPAGSQSRWSRVASEASRGRVVRARCRRHCSRRRPWCSHWRRCRSRKHFAVTSMDGLGRRRRVLRRVLRSRLLRLRLHLRLQDRSRHRLLLLRHKTGRRGSSIRHHHPRRRRMRSSRRRVRVRPVQRRQATRHRSSGRSGARNVACRVVRAPVDRLRSSQRLSRPIPPQAPPPPPPPQQRQVQPPPPPPPRQVQPPPPPPPVQRQVQPPPQAAHPPPPPPPPPRSGPPPKKPPPKPGEKPADNK